MIKNMAGYTIAVTNVVEFTDLEKAREKLEKELLTVRPRPFAVDKLTTFVRFATDKLRMTEEQASSFARTHYSFVGNLSPLGLVNIGKIVKTHAIGLTSSTSELNYSVLVIDISSPLVWSENLFDGLDEDTTKKLEQWFGYSGLIHRSAIIRKICNALGCKVTPMINKNVDSVDNKPEFQFVQPIISIGR